MISRAPYQVLNSSIKFALFYNKRTVFDPKHYFKLEINSQCFPQQKKTNFKTAASVERRGSQLNYKL